MLRTWLLAPSPASPRRGLPRRPRGRRLAPSRSMRRSHPSSSPRRWDRAGPNSRVALPVRPPSIVPFQLKAGDPGVRAGARLGPLPGLAPAGGVVAEAGDSLGAGRLVADLASDGVAYHWAQVTAGPRWWACTMPSEVPRALMAQQTQRDLWAEKVQWMAAARVPLADRTWGPHGRGSNRRGGTADYLANGDHGAQPSISEGSVSFAVEAHTGSP